MKTFKLFGRYIKKYWAMFILTVLLVISLNYIRSIIPKLTSAFVAIVEGKPIDQSEVPTFLLGFFNNANGIASFLLTNAILIVCIAFVREIINIIVDVNIYKISEIVGCKAQIDYFNKIQNLPYSYLNHAETGDLIQRSTQDINRFKRFITGSLLELFNSLCKVVVYGISMILINPEFTLYVFIMLPIYFLSSYFYFKKQSDDFVAMEEKEGEMTNVLQENLTGIRVVKAFANEKFEINKFNNSLDGYTSVWKRTTKRMSTFWGVSDILTYLQLLLVFILSIYFILNKGMDFDQVVVMFLYTEQIVWPCRNLGRQLAEFGKTSICAGRILEIVEKEDEYNEDENNTPEIKGNIEFKDVSFKFDDATIPTLTNINLSIKQGETIAIIGKTGSGKSTFVNMLNRLLDPTSGTILLDGNDIRKMDKKHVRKHVGIILQEPFLYSRTIGQNINITLPYDDVKKASELARIASVDNDIESFELKYETMVGERGVTLSGGQKQRISIARMLADQREILIFDDSLSAVDTETDLKIRNALKQKEGNTTMIIITHRITTAKDADKIVVFEDGKITHVGKHEELIKQEGLYKTIWEIQNYFNDQESVVK